MTNLLLPAALAIAIPFGFLVLVRRLDLYASAGWAPVVICLAGGLLAFPLSFVLNTAAYRLLLAGMGSAAAILAVKTLVAPVVEEIAKSGVVIWSEHRPEFTYFVDGAIYGFTAGTAFAIVENLYYLQRAQDMLGMSVNRVFSTSLMHGSASALVGVAVGRFRYGRGRTRGLSLALGWLAAMAVHMSFNRLVNAGPLDTARLATSFAVGLGGVAMTAALIKWGLWEEGRWLRETLQLGVGVSRQESGLVQRFSELDKLLAPVEERFGPAKRAQAEAFLRLQVQLGLRTKAATLAVEPAQRATLEAQAAGLRRRMDDVRRELGIYCMVFVRSIVPPREDALWQSLERRLGDEPPAAAGEGRLWGLLAERVGPAVDPPSGAQAAP